MLKRVCCSRSPYLFYDHFLHCAIAHFDDVDALLRGGNARAVYGVALHLDSRSGCGYSLYARLDVVKGVPLRSCLVGIDTLFRNIKRAFALVDVDKYSFPTYRGSCGHAHQSF